MILIADVRVNTVGILKLITFPIRFVCINYIENSFLNAGKYKKKTKLQVFAYFYLGYKYNISWISLFTFYKAVLVVALMDKDHPKEF